MTSIFRFRPPWVIGSLAVLLGGFLASAWVWYLFRAQGPSGPDATLEGLQIFGSLPEFSLTESNRRQVTRADLLGNVWVANFIYTHCTDTCPLQSARMAGLQADFPAQRDLRFLSISVDPKRDTPPVLAQYAARFGADRDRWWFLTGDQEAIYALVREGFHLSVEDPTDGAAPRTASPAPRPKAGGSPGARLAQAILEVCLATPALAHSDSDFLAPPFLHSSWFVLGDRQARIRGYYRTEDPQALERLRRDIRILFENQ